MGRYWGAWSGCSQRLLAGRLLVQGDYALGGCPAGPRPGMAVYAIPRQAVERQLHDSLVLHTTLSAARARWLMHVTLMKGACRTHARRH